MSAALVVEQLLNGLQFGVMLFLMAAGLTLIFGVMGLINLAHGSLYMIGAFAAAGVAAWTGSFWLALMAALMAAAIVGALVEMLVIRRLYDRDHLDQVLATFALILIFSEGTRFFFGSLPLYLDTPDLLSGPTTLPGGIEYSKYRLFIIAVGLAVGALLGGFENERHPAELRMIDQQLEGGPADFPLADRFVPVHPRAALSLGVVGMNHLQPLQADRFVKLPECLIEEIQTAPKTDGRCMVCGHDARSEDDCFVDRRVCP